MTANDKESLKKLSDAQILAVVIYGEARGESREGKIAVGSVVLNRRAFGITHPKWGSLYGDTISEVITAPFQFSCFNGGDPNGTKCIWIAEHWEKATEENAVLNDCYGIAQGLLGGEIKRNTNALYYHTLKARPAWRDKLTIETTIGNHIFYV